MSRYNMHKGDVRVSWATRQPPTEFSISVFQYFRIPTTGTSTLPLHDHLPKTKMLTTPPSANCRLAICEYNWLIILTLGQRMCGEQLVKMGPPSFDYINICKF